MIVNKLLKNSFINENCSIQCLKPKYELREFRTLGDALRGRVSETNKGSNFQYSKTMKVTKTLQVF